MKVIGLKESDLPEIMVHDFRKSGYLPETLNNFLALLGWSPGGDRERMSVKELIEFFSLEDVGKSNARFNREKLLAFNTEAVAAASPKRLLPAFRDYLKANPRSPLNAASDEQLATILHIKKGFRIFREVDEPAGFFSFPTSRFNLMRMPWRRSLKSRTAKAWRRSRSFAHCLPPRPNGLPRHWM